MQSLEKKIKLLFCLYFINKMIKCQHALKAKEENYMYLQDCMDNALIFYPFQTSVSIDVALI